MPKILRKAVPVTFAHRSRRAGLSSFFINANAPLPVRGGFPRGLGAIQCPYPSPYVPPPPPQKKKGIFGLGSFFIKPQSPPPLPASGVVFSRGMASFFICPPKKPVLPAASVFAGLGRNCSSCKRPCSHRGMGQMWDGNPYYQDETGAYGSPLPPDEQNLPYPTAPTYPVSLDQSTLYNQTPTVTVPTSGPAGSAVIPPSTNPSLDAFNQALTNAQATNPSLSSASVLSSLGASLATATPAQLTQATAALNASSSSVITQVSNWLAESTLLTGYKNSTVVLGGAGAIAVLAFLTSSKKGRR
jgi:hypothetical protein